MGHPVLQWQIIAKRPEKVADFYSGLFGWEISQNNALNYRMVDTGSEEGINGGIWPAPPEAPTFVQLFVGVSDVAKSVEKAVGMGARVLVPPQAMPDGDMLAILMDPEGMSFGVMSGGKV
ncbi:MAG: VOC family protein [Gemmatimonadales bacterium]|nr:VOC family protein [Gemmatimonadales bacterium]